MKRILAFSLLAALVAEPAWAQGRRGGGGGGGGRGGDGGRSGFSGGGRGSMVRPPSFSGGARPQFGSPGQSFRPSTPSIRPNLPPMQSTRPWVNPATPSFRLPSIDRPSISQTRPPIQTPNLGSRLGGTITRPYVRPELPRSGGVDRSNLIRPDRPLGSRPLDRPLVERPSTRPNTDGRSSNDSNRFGNRPPWGRGDWNRSDWNRGDWNRGRYGDWRDGRWHDHHHHHHRHWHRGWWSFAVRPWFWGGGGWWSAPNVVYYNPYVVNTTLLPAPIDYSLPLPPPDATVTVEAGVEAPLDPAATAAAALLDEGRAAFSLRDYATALDRVDEAIRKLPSDPALHEFRALTLFAMGRYADAAAAIYAVLSVGPGSTWDTVSALYLDANQYTEQLRALEAYVGANPADPASRFLLAYHYLVIGSRSAAADQLGVVTRLSPTDAVAAELLKALTAPTQT